MNRICNLLTGKSTFRTKSPPKEQAPKKAKDQPQEIQEKDTLWPPERIALLDRLWGTGITTPVGEEYALEFTQLLALDESKSVLFPGVGFGGLARAIAKQYGVWVTGFEDDECMVEQGKEISKMAGMAKKASVSLYDPENAQFKENAYNAVLSFESFYRVANKEEFFTKLVDSLYLDGFFVFTDFVAANDGGTGEKVQKWVENAYHKPHLWTAQQTKDFMKTLPLHIHIVNDITDQYRKLVFKGWLGFISGLSKAELTPDYVDIIFNECEYWIHRLAALDSGELRVFKFEATKKRTHSL